MTIALWAMVRNEEAKLATWLRYHRALGVSHFILYADRCTDRTVEIASSFDDVAIEEISLPGDQPMKTRQDILSPRAVELARDLGCEWLLGCDVDEYAWGGTADELRRSAAPDGVLDAGSLARLVDRADPAIEQTWLETLETVPLAIPPGRSFYHRTWVQRMRPLGRSIVHPSTGEEHLMTKFLGHRMGKVLTRLSADLVSDGPHQWRRSDGEPPTTLNAGLHLHYFVSDFDTWQRDCRIWAELGDTWDGVNPRPYPRNEWRDFVASSSLDEQRDYYDASVVVPESTLAAQESEFLFPTDVVQRVLDAAKPNGGKKLVFIGLDCFDHELAEPWIDEGALPSLRGVAGRSVRIDTVGPPGTFVNNTWPDLYSGVGAAKHGTQCWKQLTRGTYDFEWRHVRHAQTQPVIWDSLDDAGYRCAVVDAPLVPGWPANGLQVFEWGSHDPELGFSAHPEGLAEEIVELVGEHAVSGHCNRHGRTVGDYARFRDDLVEGASKRAALFSTLLDRDSWDLFFAVYSEAHCSGHQAWHLHDPTSPKWNAEDSATVGDVVKTVYRAIDSSLGEVLGHVDDETTVMVWMSHGMGNHTYPTYLNDQILFALDEARHVREAARLEAMVKMSPDAVAPRPAPTIDDRASRLFFDHMNNDPESGVRINLVGREPSGLVQPGREYDQICDWLAEQYLKLTDADSGEPLVDDVLFTTEHYEGPYLVDLPDLFVQWRRGSSIVTRVESPSVDRVITGHPYSCRSGDHHPRGRLFVSGPGVDPGVAAQDEALLSRDLTALLTTFFSVDMEIDGSVPGELTNRVLGH